MENEIKDNRKLTMPLGNARTRIAAAWAARGSTPLYGGGLLPVRPVRRELFLLFP